MKKAIKFIFWKIYFFIITIFLVLANLAAMGEMKFLDYIDILMTIIVLVALFGFSFEKKIFIAIFWKIYFFLFIAWQIIFYFFFISPYMSNAIELFISILILLLIYSPLCVALYVYGFKFGQIKSVAHDSQSKVISGENKKVYIFSKIFSIALLLYSLFPLGMILAAIFKWDLILAELYKRNIQPIGQAEFLISLIPVFIYCLVGGVGLFRLKKWAMLFVSIIGLLIFLRFILETIQALMGLPLPNSILIKIILGASSFYLLRNRHLFNK